ncbi:hypothetical protein ACIBF5_11680 [Micromonospora sp. NPDC050417]|uniref:hypothetical protein n=1 Tax=Micromonospora sp. NPDC050417 TaxID=3364280 RepID=UPI0037A6010E
MTCHTADYQGKPTASNEIAEVTWLGYADRHRVSALDQVIFDRLYAQGLLR